MSRSILWTSVTATLLAVVLALGFGGSVAFAATGPEAAIAALQKGITTRDISLVETHLDIDAVATSAAIQIFTDKEVAKEVARHPALSLMLALGGNVATNEALLSLFTSEAREYVEYGVRSGAFTGKTDTTQPPYQGLFGKAFRGNGKDTKTFGPAEILQRTKNTAFVATTLTEGAKGRAYPLQLRLERQDAVWRVTELVNVADFVRRRKEKANK